MPKLLKRVEGFADTETIDDEQSTKDPYNKMMLIVGSVGSVVLLMIILFIYNK